MTNRILLYFQIIWSNLSYLFIDLSLIFKRKIFINCYAVRKYNDISHINWGDDINYYFLDMICSKKIVIKNRSLLYRFFPAKNFCCIGSILGDFIDNWTEIWGSGIISADKSFVKTPKKIHSVRGPLTRDVLLKNNIQCPEIYGDPALLISKFYKPKSLCRNHVGIILHYVDSDNHVVKEYINQHKDCIVINMRGYDCWTDVIDAVCSCDIILSSSLHGLIIADSYNIPNVWIVLSDNIVGGDFKFNDYFASVKRKEEKYQIRETGDFDRINLSGIKYNATVDYDSIFSSCPFKNSIKWRTINE